MTLIRRLILGLLLLGVPETLMFAQGLLQAKPEEVGLSSERLQRIRPVMQQYVDQGKVAGLMTMVARHGKVVHFETYGMRDKAAQQPMQRDTIFRIFSMTKPVTAVAVMMLYEEGRFQLDDPVAKYIPEFKDVQVYAGGPSGTMQVVPLDRPITIRHLLTQTAGLTYGGVSSNTPVDSVYQRAKVLESATLSEMIRKLGQIPLLYQPGSQFHYSVASDVLGHLVEVVSGLPFDQFLAQRIFVPLKMPDTGFSVPPEKRQRLAVLYRMTATGALEPSPETPGMPGLQQTRLFLGGSGLVSTPGDYLRFAQMLLNGGELEGQRLLGRKTVDFMLRNHLPPPMLALFRATRFHKGAGFGLGLAVVMDVAETEIMQTEGVAYWAGAANTYFWLDPKEDLIIMVWAQFFPFGRSPFGDEIRVLTYQALID